MSLGGKKINFGFNYGDSVWKRNLDLSSIAYQRLSVYHHSKYEISISSHTYTHTAVSTLIWVALYTVFECK